MWYSKLWPKENGADVNIRYTKRGWFAVENFDSIPLLLQDSFDNKLRYLVITDVEDIIQHIFIALTE